MEELTIDNVVEQMEATIAGRLDTVAGDFATLLRGRIPRRKKGKSRGTASKVAVEVKGKLRRDVTVPWPWSWGEFGTVRQKANPVVRQTLLDNQRRYEDFIAGR